MSILHKLVGHRLPMTGMTAYGSLIDTVVPDCTNVNEFVEQVHILRIHDVRFNQSISVSLCFIIRDDDKSKIEYPFSRMHKTE